MNDDFNQARVEQAPVNEESESLSRQVNDSRNDQTEATVSRETLNNPSQWAFGPRQESYDLPQSAEQQLRKRFQS